MVPELQGPPEETPVHRTQWNTNHHQPTHIQRTIDARRYVLVDGRVYGAGTAHIRFLRGSDQQRPRRPYQQLG